MNIANVKEWLKLADNDFDSAILLSEAQRKHHEIICYHCSQSVEKYLKGYLTYNNVIPQKTHDLLYLNNLCISIENSFSNIMLACGFLNRFSNDIRYPHPYEINDIESNLALEAVKKIRNFKPINDLTAICSSLN